MNAGSNLIDGNWDALAYDIGSAAGAAVVGGIRGRATAESVNRAPSPPWGFRSDFADHYNPKLGSVMDWFKTGPSPGSAAGAVAAAAAGPASIAGRGCGC